MKNCIVLFQNLVLLLPLGGCHLNCLGLLTHGCLLLLDFQTLTILVYHAVEVPDMHECVPFLCLLSSSTFHSCFHDVEWSDQVVHFLFGKEKHEPYYSNSFNYSFLFLGSWVKKTLYWHFFSLCGVEFQAFHKFCRSCGPSVAAFKFIKLSMY